MKRIETSEQEISTSARTSFYFIKLFRSVPSLFSDEVLHVLNFQAKKNKKQLKSYRNFFLQK